MRKFFFRLVLALVMFMLGLGAHAALAAVPTPTSTPAATAVIVRFDAGSDFAGNGSTGDFDASDFFVAADVTTDERGSPTYAPTGALVEQVSVNTVRGYDFRRARDPAILPGRIYLKPPFTNPGANKARTYKHSRTA